MPTIQTPGSYDDEADEVAKRLVEGEEPEAPATPVPTTKAPEGAPAKNEDGPYGMTKAAWEALGPEGQWAKMLEQFKVTPDEARKMMRQILARGFVTRKYPLWGGALNVTLRNPVGEHRLRVARELDRLDNPTRQMEVESTNRLNLAGCLLAYEDGTNDKQFAFPERNERDPAKLDKLFGERWEFIDTIPPKVQPHLYIVLNHFMGLVSAVLANGAVGSF
jgi:hypothetical protein